MITSLDDIKSLGHQEMHELIRRGQPARELVERGEKVAACLESWKYYHIAVFLLRYDHLGLWYPGSVVKAMARHAEPGVRELAARVVGRADRFDEELISLALSCMNEIFDRNDRMQVGFVFQCALYDLSTRCGHIPREACGTDRTSLA